MVFNIEIDTEKMSLKEIKEARDNIQEVVDSLNHYIRTCETAKNKFAE